MEKKVLKLYDDGKYHFFELYPNTEPIEIGDLYVFAFGGEWFYSVCSSEQERSETNYNPNRKPNKGTIDLVTNFWTHCYKVKNTSFNYKDYGN